MEPMPDFSEGILLSVEEVVRVEDGWYVEGVLFEEFLRAFERRVEKKGMFLEGGGAEEV